MPCFCSLGLRTLASPGPPSCLLRGLSFSRSSGAFLKINTKSLTTSITCSRSKPLLSHLDVSQGLLTGLPDPPALWLSSREQPERSCVPSQSPVPSATCPPALGEHPGFCLRTFCPDPSMPPGSAQHAGSAQRPLLGQLPSLSLLPFFSAHGPHHTLRVYLVFWVCPHSGRSPHAAENL